MTTSQTGDTFQPGDVLNNTYRIEAVLGRGGTSEVYRATNEINGRQLALKVLQSDMASNADYLVLMTREEEIRDVRHDAVVRYFENQRTRDGHVFLVMDYVDGPGLDQKLKDGGMSAEDLLVIGERVAKGLIATHSHNIVHRDLSPDNIILRNGVPAEAVIIDFGIAKDTNPGAATIVGNEFAGKYAYAAPEQLSGKSDERSDIYALGALLLATFRGKAPDVGGNPMEVIENKSKPLDTDGVPEPLKSVIDRMTQPDPANRFQTATEVVTAINPDPLALLAGVDTPVSEPPSMAPEPAVAAPARQEKTTAPDRKKKPSRTKPEKKKSRGGLVWVLLLLLIGGGAGGAWYTGMLEEFFPTPLPQVDPYTLIAERKPDTAPSLLGHAPSEEAAARLSAPMAELGGTADLTLAAGDIPEGWADSVARVLATVSPLEEWRVAVNNDDMAVTGLTIDRNLRARIQAALANEPMAERVDIALGPRLLPVAEVETLMTRFADCGPLTLADAPAEGFPMGSQIAISGTVGAAESRARLFDALSLIAGDRQIAIDTDVLNPGLCLIDQLFAGVPTGGFGIRFGYGDRPDPNPDGAYDVGDNPTIDVVIPAGLSRGFLWVSIMDVTGNVYHLLPNITRPDNSVVNLRGGVDGEVEVRVAYSIAEALGDRTRLSFLVDETFGKSRIVVIHSSAPLFDELRPTTESLASYAEVLGARLEEGTTTIHGLDSRIIESRQ